MKYLLVSICFLCFACNNSKTVRPANSSDSAMKAIDPKGTISDTSQYPIDSAGKDSASTGVTH
jgi:hypothetical protein